MPGMAFKAPRDDRVEIASRISVNCRETVKPNDSNDWGFHLCAPFRKRRSYPAHFSYHDLGSYRVFSLLTHFGGSPLLLQILVVFGASHRCFAFRRIFPSV